MEEEIKGKVDQGEPSEDYEAAEEAAEMTPLELQKESEEAALEEVEVGEIESLRAEVEQQQQQSQEYLDGWQRERAEFTNYKKRKEKEYQQLRINISGEIIRKYLEVLDDLERALKNRPEEGEGATWAEGIELIYRKFLGALESDGVVRMQAEGEYFDPNLHEAISQEPNDEFESGQVIEVLRNGYLIGERVLRPASVRVAQ
jgi:molecular chaperone GrpE